MFFAHDNIDFLIYGCGSAYGHDVVSLNTDWAVTYKYKTPGITWDYGEIRGGTPPVRVGDEYFCFTHSFHSFGGTQWGHHLARYVMGAYAFEAKPPFKITRYTKTPFAAGSAKDPMYQWSKPIVFPDGARFDNGLWTVVYGVNDAACGWMRIPHGELVDMMEIA
jgi:predicted GH43/DUF377 family glycosyl hydrolase